MRWSLCSAICAMAFVHCRLLKKWLVVSWWKSVLRSPEHIRCIPAGVWVNVCLDHCFLYSARVLLWADCCVLFSCIFPNPPTLVIYLFYARCNATLQITIINVEETAIDLETAIAKSKDIIQIPKQKINSLEDGICAVDNCAGVCARRRVGMWVSKSPGVETCIAWLQCCRWLRPIGASK